MAQQFDVIVIGSGSAGNTCALACRAAGMTVAIVDSLPFGGTCVLRGCDPKKVLVGVAELIDCAERLHEKGAIRGEVHIDWRGLMKFKRTFTEPIPAQREQAFRDAGIVALHGRAHFIGPTSISLNGETLSARYVVIATGAWPVPLNVPGQELAVTSDVFLDLDELPREIVFIGGGYVSFEFAGVASRAGAKATILHRGDRALQGFDADLVGELTSACRNAGIDVQLKAAVTGIERVGNRVRVHANQAGADRVFEADLAVHGAGRAPDLADLRLDVAGIQTTRKGVAVNQYLQSTTNAAVYAAGDCADGGGLPLTPVAGTEGEVVAENLVHGNRRTIDFSVLPSVCYSIPAIATVGFSEAAASDKKLNFRLERGSMDPWYSTRRVNGGPSYYKMLIDDSSGKILGAHLLGPQVEEQINVISIAMQAGMTAKAVADAFFAYPTGGSDIQYMVPGAA